MEFNFVCYLYYPAKLKLHLAIWQCVHVLMGLTFSTCIFTLLWAHWRCRPVRSVRSPTPRSSVARL